MKKTILITGSSRGIGREIAKLAGEQGWKVYLHGKTDSEKLDSLQKEIDDSEKLFFNLNDKTATEVALSKITKIDCLVNNAGSIISDGRWDGEESKVRQSFEENVIGTWRVTKELVGKFNKNGSIINLCSEFGSRCPAGAVIGYSMSKAALEAFTLALAKELAPNIRVIGVAPSVVNTDMTLSAGEELLDKLKSNMLAGRIAEPKEIAELIMFLASDKASFISSEVIHISSGYSIKGK